MPERAYRTGLVADGSECNAQAIRGRGWRVEFQVTGKSRRMRTAAASGRVYLGREVTIFAESWVRAQVALSLVSCGMELRDSTPLFGGPDERPVAHNKDEPEDESFRIVAHGMHRFTPGIPDACAMAARTSGRRRWAYALEKYAVSLELFAIHYMETDPSHSRHIKISRWPSQQVRSAQALVVAYSAIEDLGLELRASSSKPSRINGEWNPAVRDDLLERLERAGVAHERPFPWMVRGPRTAVEQRRAVPDGSRESWTYGVMVRDRSIPLIDAIARADWLRDKVAAHATNYLTKSLSPYDVVNVQMLARWLLLYVLRSPLAFPDRRRNAPRIVKRTMRVG